MRSGYIDLDYSALWGSGISGYAWTRLLPSTVSRAYSFGFDTVNVYILGGLNRYYAFPVP